MQAPLPPVLGLLAHGGGDLAKLDFILSLADADAADGAARNAAVADRAALPTNDGPLAVASDRRAGSCARAGRSRAGVGAHAMWEVGLPHHLPTLPSTQPTLACFLPPTTSPRIPSVFLLPAVPHAIAAPAVAQHTLQFANALLEDFLLVGRSVEQLAVVDGLLVAAGAGQKARRELLVLSVALVADTTLRAMEGVVRASGRVPRGRRAHGCSQFSQFSSGIQN